MSEDEIANKPDQPKKGPHRFGPGNQYALGLKHPITSAVARIKNDFVKFWDDPAKLDLLNESLLDILQTGKHKDKMEAVKYVHDRMMGKVTQMIDLTANAKTLDPMTYTDAQVAQVLSILGSNRPQLPSPTDIIDVTPVKLEVLESELQKQAEKPHVEG